MNEYIKNSSSKLKMNKEIELIKSSEAQSSGIHSYQFSSLETWTDFSGWQTAARQIEPGVLDARFFTATSPQIQLHHMQFNRSLHQQGLPSKDHLHIGIPYHQGRLLWHRSNISAGCLVSHNAKEGFEVVSDSGLKNFIVSINRTLVEDLSSALALDFDFEKLASSNTVYNLNVDVATTLLQNLQCFYQAVHDSPEPPLFSALEDLQSNLPILILETLTKAETNNYKSEKYAHIRNKGLERALAYINQNPQDAITVQEVCKVASVNWRTLQRAFRDQFDVTPKTYLKAVRLNGARKELLAADRTEKVANIANSWGFWHLSQFAADYRKLFGELPTASLKR